MVAADGKSLDLQGAQWITAPYDEMALEKALQLRDGGGGGGGSVTVVCAGPPEASKELRTALAMGADKAVHVVSKEPGLDALATSEALAAAVKGLMGILNGDKGAALAADHAMIKAAGSGFAADAMDVAGNNIAVGGATYVGTATTVATATSVNGLAMGTIPVTT